MRLIFSSILGGHFDHQFPSTSLDLRRRLLKPMVDSSVELYLTVSLQLAVTQHGSLIISGVLARLLVHSYVEPILKESLWPKLL